VCLGRLTANLGAAISRRSANDDGRSRTAPNRTSPRTRLGMHIAACVLRRGPDRSCRAPGTESCASGCVRTTSCCRACGQRNRCGLAFSRRGHLRRVAAAGSDGHGHARYHDQDRNLRCRRHVSVDDLADGKWTIDIQMQAFAPLHAEVTIAPSLPAAAYELKLLSPIKSRPAHKPRSRLRKRRLLLPQQRSPSNRSRPRERSPRRPTRPLRSPRPPKKTSRAPTGFWCRAA